MTVLASSAVLSGDVPNGIAIFPHFVHPLTPSHGPESCRSSSVPGQGAEVSLELPIMTLAIDLFLPCLTSFSPSDTDITVNSEATGVCAALKPLLSSEHGPACCAMQITACHRNSLKRLCSPHHLNPSFRANVCRERPLCHLRGSWTSRAVSQPSKTSTHGFAKRWRSGRGEARSSLSRG